MYPKDGAGVCMSGGNLAYHNRSFLAFPYLADDFPGFLAKFPSPQRALITVRYVTMSGFHTRDPVGEYILLRRATASPCTIIASAVDDAVI